MPSIGPLEIMVVCVVALVVFGPARLPEIARSLGKALSELKRQASDMKSEFDTTMNIDDLAADDEPEAPGEDKAPGPIVHKGTTQPGPARPVSGEEEGNDEPSREPRADELQ